MEGGDLLKASREAWERMRRLERVEEVVARASNAEAGSFERALASGFRALLNDPRRSRGFTVAERRPMQQIASGSAGVRALRGFASLSAPSSVSGVAATAGAAFGGAGPAAAVLPALSWGAGATANAVVRGQGNALPAMVGQGDARRAAADALLRQPNALAGFATAPTSIGVLDHLSVR